jgi:hypothetical protein
MERLAVGDFAKRVILEPRNDARHLFLETRGCVDADETALYLAMILEVVPRTARNQDVASARCI